MARILNFFLIFMKNITLELYFLLFRGLRNSVLHVGFAVFAHGVCNRRTWDLQRLQIGYVLLAQYKGAIWTKI